MKIGVVSFPGSNCEGDAVHAGRLLGHDVVRLWHKDTSLPAGIDLIILPGGFSYGDYLRTGAIARFSPVMADVIRFAHAGGYVMGICNGFQILTEAGLLPGALIRNASLSFVCKDTYLRVENVATPYTNILDKGSVVRIPVAHGDGRFTAPLDVIERIEQEGRVVFRYCTADGTITDEANPNGSINNIAGIVNHTGNVMGMMPHPERYVETSLGGTDGRGIFESITAYIERVSAHALA